MSDEGNFVGEEKEIANPQGHVVLGEEEPRAIEVRYVALEAEL